VTEGEAAPAARESDSRSRNLLMRVAVAAVLVPLAVAIAYAGGWLWATLVTLAAIGLFLEWLTVVGLAGATRVSVSGVVALAVAGLCFAMSAWDLLLACNRMCCGANLERKADNKPPSGVLLYICLCE